MRVLVIPEDERYDQFIVKPVVEAMLAEIGVRGRVDVLREPALRGASEALDPAIVRTIVEENPMEDVFVLVVDRDCDRAGHTAKAKAREAEHPGKVVSCVAVEEIEVWMLALHRSALGTPLREVRRDCDPKERWAIPLLEQLGDGGPGRGRKRAMAALKGNYRSLRDSCEEIRALEDAIRALYATRT